MAVNVKCWVFVSVLPGICPLAVKIVVCRMAVVIVANLQSCSTNGTHENLAYTFTLALLFFCVKLEL